MVALADFESAGAFEHAGRAGRPHFEAAFRSAERADFVEQPRDAGIGELNGIALALCDAIEESGSMKCNRPPTRTFGS